MNCLSRFTGKGGGQWLQARKGIPKNFSSQVFVEVRVNFLGEFLLKTLQFVNRRSKLFRNFLGRLWLILCYWKTFSVPKWQACCHETLCVVTGRHGSLQRQRVDTWDLAHVHAWPRSMHDRKLWWCQERSLRQVWWTSDSFSSTILADIITKKSPETIIFVFFSWSFSS